MKIKNNYSNYILYYTFIPIFVFWVIFILINFFVNYDFSFDVSNKIINFRINGIVDTINIKPQSHNSEYIKIINIDSTIIYENIEFFDQAFIKNVRIGDTIYSESKSDSILIKRDGKIFKFKKAYK